jgi:3-dehydroquinate synthase
VPALKRNCYPTIPVAATSAPVAPVHVNVNPPGSPRYRITVGAGVLAGLDALLAESGFAGRQTLVTSPTVWKAVRDRLPAPLTAREPVLMPDGERHKHMATVARVYDGLLAASADRSTVIVAVGGGVVGDTAGFAAATFLRGLPLVHVPTTLLAQVDSSIGGKVGVNHPLGKNLIGAFYQPRAVVIDPTALATLPRREFRAGLYEVVKYGVIASANLFERVRTALDQVFNRDEAVLVPVIAECCAIKAGVVERDEREQGERRHLNFGHTIGHALEAVTNYRRFRHGEAVGYGMLAASKLALSRKAISRPAHQALNDLIGAMGPMPPIGDLSATEALTAVRRDKKVIRGTLHFVLPTDIGSVEVVNDVSEKELLAAMRGIGMQR